MLINEIFESIDGEAKRAGELATFIRASGCNLRCSWCDTKYSWEKEESTRLMGISEIVNICRNYGHINVTFTGGEPLIQSDADPLITELSRKGFDVCIETNGSIKWSDRDWFFKPFYKDNVWVCADYKMPTSGETDKMLPLEEFATLREQDVLKFVVASRKELELAKEVIDGVRSLGSQCWAFLSPVFGDIEPKEIVEFMLENHMDYKVKCQVQLHKILWDPNKRGV